MRIGDKPLVSIGMPIYNSEKFIRQALDSLLKQDYEHFEVIISDNHSTDATREICLDYAARDGRLRYFRNEMNVGAIRNFNKVFEISQGEYFMWHAHDDYKESNYISSCLNIFGTHPNIILCCSNALLNEKGRFRELRENFNTMGMSPNKRFRKILWNNSCASIYGLMRRSVLGKTGLFRDTIGSDNLLLAELSLMGEFYQLPLFLFKVEIRSGSIFKKIKAIFETTLPSGKQNCFFPFTKLALEHWRLIQNSELVGMDRLIAFLDIIFCFSLKYKIFLSDPVFTFYLNLSKLSK